MLTLNNQKLSNLSSIGGIVTPPSGEPITLLSYITGLGPVKLHKFDEASGALVEYGSVGAAAGNMAAGGSPLYQQVGQLGANEAIDLDGSNARFSVGNNAAFQISTLSAFSICALVNIDSDGENNLGTIFGKGSNFFYITEVSAGVTAKVVVLIDHATTDANTQTSDTFNLNSWLWINYIYNRNGDKKGEIFFNGVKATLGTDIAGVGSIVDDSSMDFIIGDIRFNNRNQDGTNDMFAFFDKALTPTNLSMIATLSGL